MEVMGEIKEFMNSTVLTNILLLIAIASLFRIEKVIGAVQDNTFFLRKD